MATLRLSWPRAAGAGGEESRSEPLVFLHLLGPKGQVLRTFDHPFPQHWVAGTPVSYDVKLYQSALAPPLDPGKYRLTVGLYDQGGRRWALAGLGEPIARQEYLPAELVLPPILVGGWARLRKPGGGGPVAGGPAGRDPRGGHPRAGDAVVELPHPAGRRQHREAGLSRPRHQHPFRRRPRHLRRGRDGD